MPQQASANAGSSASPYMKGSGRIACSHHMTISQRDEMTICMAQSSLRSFCPCALSSERLRRKSSMGRDFYS